MSACIAEDDPESGPLVVTLRATVAERRAACENDPRVLLGLVTEDVCAGAGIFFRETFDGNGRTCATCHPVENNFTIDAPFIETLDDADPLFVAENDPGLATLEIPELLRDFGLIRENVDGVEDLDDKFTMRSVSHTLSLATSITRDPGDGTIAPPNQRTGWSGDGAPGNGELRDFLAGAVNQHMTADLGRTPGVSFRAITEEELDLSGGFQILLGRTNELDLDLVTISDPEAAAGVLVFRDTVRGRCENCHANAGANFGVTQLNRVFNTGVENARLDLLDELGIPLDGGFGGRNRVNPNFDTDGDGTLDAFGDGRFNTPPLIEAADTAPFFHGHSHATLEDAIAFYGTDAFNNSPSGIALSNLFGGPNVLTLRETRQIGRFLRVLNAAFNCDLAVQRLNAANAIALELGNTNLEIQTRLIELAIAELNDAIQVLSTAPFGLHANSQTRFTSASRDLEVARTTTSAAARRTRTTNALTRIALGRDLFGQGITFTLGEANVMF